MTPIHPEICAQSDPPLFEHHSFHQYPVIAPQQWELAKDVQSALIGSRPRAFQRAIDEPCTLPISPPKGGTKRDFAGLPVKSNVCQKMSVTKFLCMKTSSGKVVARPTSFIYLTVHRWTAGDVNIYHLPCALKMTHFFRKRRFWQISLDSAAGVRASERSSIIANRNLGSRQCAFHRAMDEPCALPPKSPKGWLKTRIFTFGVVFHFFVAGNRRHFKFGMWVEHSKSQPTDDKLSLKWAWPRHVTHSKIVSPPKISLEWPKLKT